MAQFLGWDESNFLRLQSMLGGAGTSMHNGQKCIDFVPKFNFMHNLLMQLFFTIVFEQVIRSLEQNSIARVTFDVAS